VITQLPISNLNRHEFDVRFNRLQQILDASERAGYRAWTGAARALVVHAELVAIQTDHMEVAAVGAARIGSATLRTNSVQSAPPSCVTVIHLST